MLQVLIPISLYVSIEIVKLGQIYFIQNDLDLYDARLDTGIQCRALNITEDLGQIQYLFSDKTGTLTENRMLFRRCTVVGKEYPHNEHGEFSPSHRPILIRRQTSLGLVNRLIHFSSLVCLYYKRDLIGLSNVQICTFNSIRICCIIFCK